MPEILTPDRPSDPREHSKPRRRLNIPAIVLGLLIALTPEPSNAVVVGLLGGVVLITTKWVWLRVQRGREGNASTRR